MSLEEEAGAISYGITVGFQKLIEALESSGKKKFTIEEIKQCMEDIK